MLRNNPQFSSVNPPCLRVSVVKIIFLLALVLPSIACLGSRKPLIVSESDFTPPVVYIEGAELPSAKGQVPAAELGTKTIEGTDENGIIFGEGLGHLNKAIVEDDILADGRLIRLVQAAGEAKAKWAIGVSKTSGVQIERETGRATAYGNGPVVILDLSKAKINRKKRHYENIRASFIWPGDTWSFLEANVRYVPEIPQGRDVPSEDESQTMAVIAGVTRRSMAVLECNFSDSGEPTHQLLLRREPKTMMLGGDFAPGQEIKEYPTISQSRMDLVPKRKDLP